MRDSVDPRPGGTRAPVRTSTHGETTAIPSRSNSSNAVRIVLIALVVAGVRRVVSSSRPAAPSSQHDPPAAEVRAERRLSASSSLPEPRSTDRSAEAPRRREGAFRFESFGVLITLGGVTAYSLLYVAALRFYRPLGVSPSDVGLSYASLLAQCAITLIAPAVAAALLSALGFGAGFLVDRRRQRVADRAGDAVHRNRSVATLTARAVLPSR